MYCSHSLSFRGEWDSEKQKGVRVGDEVTVRAVALGRSNKAIALRVEVKTETETEREAEGMRRGE